MNEIQIRLSFVKNGGVEENENEGTGLWWRKNGGGEKKVGGRRKWGGKNV